MLCKNLIFQMRQMSYQKAMTTHSKRSPKSSEPIISTCVSLKTRTRSLSKSRRCSSGWSSKMKNGSSKKSSERRASPSLLRTQSLETKNRVRKKDSPANTVLCKQNNLKNLLNRPSWCPVQLRLPWLSLLRLRT